MPITVSVVGFYFETSVDPAGITTVLDAMNRVKNKRAANGGIMDFSVDTNTGFINEISVNYDPASTPKTRQNLAGGAPVPDPDRQKGRYVFNDAIIINGQFNSNIELSVVGGVDGILAWQYYLFDQGGVQKNNNNEIVALGRSLPIVDGDKIVWRLIGIFGLNDKLKSAIAANPGIFAGQTLSLKSALKQIQ